MPCVIYGGNDIGVMAPFAPQVVNSCKSTQLLGHRFSFVIKIQATQELIHVGRCVTHVQSQTIDINGARRHNQVLAKNLSTYGKTQVMTSRPAKKLRRMPVLRTRFVSGSQKHIGVNEQDVTDR